MRATSFEWSHVGGADLGALRAHARKMLGEHAQDADDVVQDVLLAARGRLDEKTAEERTAYLYAMVRNRCVDEHRRSARWIPVDPIDDRVVIGSTPEDEPEQVVARRASIEHLTDDLLRLPERQREVVLAHAFDGCSHQQISDRNGMTPEQSRSLLKRARSTLTALATARNAPCEDIRGQLDVAHARGVRPSEHARRHLWTCPACQTYRTARRAAVLTVPALQDLLLHLIAGPATAVTGRIAAGSLALVAPTLVPMGVVERDADPVAVVRQAVSQPMATASSFPVDVVDRAESSSTTPRSPTTPKPALTPEAAAASRGWSPLARRQLAQQSPAAQRRFVQKLAAACSDANGSPAPASFLVRHCPDLVPAEEPDRPKRSAVAAKPSRPETTPTEATEPSRPKTTPAAAVTQAAPPPAEAPAPPPPPTSPPPAAAPSVASPPVEAPPAPAPPAEEPPPAPPAAEPVSEPPVAPQSAPPPS